MKGYKKLLTIISLFAIALAGCNSGSGSGGDTNEKTYTITWNNYDGTLLEKDEKVKEGTVPTYDGATPTRAEDDTYSYTWAGWDPEVEAANSDKTYTATYNREKIKYIIDFDLNGGTSESYTGPKTVEELSKNDFFFDCVKADYNFRGWSYNGVKVFDEKGIQVANPKMEKHMTFVAMYAQTAKLSIIKNIEEAGTVTGEGEYAYNTDVDISAKPNDGYFFLGWYVNDIIVSSSQDYKYRMWSEDVTIEARFSLNVYHLHVESNNPSLGLVRISRTDSAQNLASDDEYFTHGVSVTIIAYTITETRFLGWFNEDNELVDTSAVYTFIMPEDEYRLEAKWNHFNITYKLDGGINDEDNPDSYTQESNPITLKPATRDGYRFDGWKLGEEFITVINPSWLKHIELTAVWSVDTYTVTYVLYGGTNNENNPATYTKFDKTYTLQDPVRAGYEFGGWYLDGGFNDEITEIAAGSSGNLTIYAKWTLITYSITYILDGGTNNENNPATYTVEDVIELQDPSRTGYGFAGWFDSENNEVTELNHTTGAITLTATWTLNKHQININVYPEGFGTFTISTGAEDDEHAYYNSNVTINVTPSNNHKFKGFYDNDAGMYVCDKNKYYIFKMPDDNVSLTLMFYTAEQEKLIDEGRIPYFYSKTIVSYGLYPQTKVTDNNIIKELDKLSEPTRYYQYNGKYYALRATGEENRSWFECEPISWEVLETSKNGNIETYKLLSRKLLFTYCYYDGTSNRTIDGKTIYPNNYKYSDIRKWLNEDFFEKTFVDAETSCPDLKKTTFKTYNHTGGSEYVVADTLEDYVFMLSAQEYLSYFEKDSTRICTYTDYGSFAGAETKYLTSTAFTMLADKIYVHVVDNSSGIVYNYLNCNYWYGIRPAITISVNIGQK